LFGDTDRPYYFTSFMAFYNSDWQTSRWGQWSFPRNYDYPTSEYYGPYYYVTWCQSAGQWQSVTSACAADTTCESDGQMKVDFINFVLNITNQNQLPNLDPNQHQGFCAVDLQPLFDDNYKTQRNTWADNELVKGTLSATNTQKAFKITHLAEYVYLPSETTNGNGGGSTGGGGSGAFDNPVTIVFTLTYAFSNIIDRQAFELSIRQDFATALGVPIERIVIDLVAGVTLSVIHIMATQKTVVTFHITPAADFSTPTAEALGNRLKNDLFTDPNSQLYKGTYTQYTDSSVTPTVVNGLTNAAASVIPSYIISIFALVVAFFAKY